MPGETTKTVMLFHGTSALFRPGIEENGLRSARRRGEVYVTASMERAKAYSAAWSVALQTLGVSPSRSGIVVACRVPVGTPAKKGQPLEYSIDPRHLTLDSIAEAEFEPTDLEAIGWVCQCVGILGWPHDPYVCSEPYGTWLKSAVRHVKRFSDDDVSAAMVSVPCF